MTERDEARTAITRLQQAVVLAEGDRDAARSERDEARARVAAQADLSDRLDTLRRQVMNLTADRDRALALLRHSRAEFRLWHGFLFAHGLGFNGDLLAEIDALLLSEEKS